MSKTDDTKIVQIKDRINAAGASGDRVGELLKRVRSIASSRLESAVRTMFDNADDVLFDLAEKASSNAQQVQFFDGMRELRKSRTLIERRFLEHLSRGFVSFSQGVAKSAPVAPESTVQPAAASLALVGELELEESLAISAMVAKAESRLARALFAVNRRLSVIIGGGEVDDGNSPIAPAAIGSAFRAAMSDVDAQLAIKLITFKLFERYAMASLDKLYDEVNAELINSGVLPQGVQKGHVGNGGTSQQIAAGNGTTAPHGEAHVSRHGYSPDAHSSIDAYAASTPRSGVDVPMEVFESLRALLTYRHPQAMDRQHHVSREAAVPVDPKELIGLLSALQGQLTPGYEARAQNPDGSIDAMRLTEQVKRNLLEQAGRQSGGRSRAVSSADEDTIDLVGMLFEFILSDRSLPLQFQGILGRLQIPYLKVAVLDKHLFAQAAHPARRLLDALARAGLSWSEESDPEHRLLNKVNSVVERILMDFDDDIGIFDSERTDFEHFVDLHRKRAELAEQRAAETAQGREKLDAARRRSAGEIMRRIDGRELPPIIHDILSRPWANYLVMTQLRHGEDSAEWRNGLRFADELVWSALPKNTPRDSERLQKLLPQLEAALRHGLNTIASHGDDIHRTLDGLSGFYRAVLAGVPVPLSNVREVVAGHASPTAGDGSALIGEPPLPSPVEELLMAADEIDGTADNRPAIPPNDPWIATARSLKSGAWFEFTAADGDLERAKLAWVSPFTSNFLFVNRRGQKVAERSIEQLAAEMRDGRAVLLEQTPLFDRALDAVVGRLRAGRPDGREGEALIDA